MPLQRFDLYMKIFNTLPREERDAICATRPISALIEELEKKGYLVIPSEKNYYGLPNSFIIGYTSNMPIAEDVTLALKQNNIPFYIPKDRYPRDIKSIS